MSTAELRMASFVQGLALASSFVLGGFRLAQILPSSFSASLMSRILILSLVLLLNLRSFSFAALNSGSSESSGLTRPFPRPPAPPPPPRFPTPPFPAADAAVLVTAAAVAAAAAFAAFFPLGAFPTSAGFWSSGLTSAGESGGGSGPSAEAGLNCWRDMAGLREGEEDCAGWVGAGGCRRRAG